MVLQPPRDFPPELPLDVLQPRIVVGEISQALLQAQFQPKEMKSVQINETIREIALRDKLRSVVFILFQSSSNASRI
jgi:hypothetical protein